MADRSDEFAMRLRSVDDLWFEFDARPVAERQMVDEVHDHLLDEWERLRDKRPSTLVVYAPASERPATDEAAVRAAIQGDIRASREPLRRAGPLSRRERNAFWIGVVVMLGTIIVSTLLERASDAVVVEGVSQGIVVFGWVALWQPAAHFVTEVLPHYFNRRRYKEFADVDVRFDWV
jgi:hypothetical protein